MNTSPNRPNEAKAREAAWSPLVSQLHRSDAPSEAINLNVEGRQVVGPLQGFGQLWQKTYKVRLSGVDTTPAQVIQTWKENFPKFWPANNYFCTPLTGITPGEVALLNLEMPGGMPLSTGMLVLYADSESFTLMTPQGHMESGWITFSAFEEENFTVVQVQSMARANDPMYEVGFWLFAHRKQEMFWEHTLTALAAHFGVNGQVRMYKTCVDRRLQWSQAKNIWHNAAIRTAIYAPVHFFKKQFASSR
jgi:hypothetical protein